MKKLIISMFMFLFVVLIAGCPINRGDFKFDIVRKNDIAKFDGVFVNEEWWILEGQTIPDDGYLIWWEELDPNNLD